MLPQKSLMLQKATSALSCVFLGKLHRDKPVLRYGVSLYNEAIHEMSKTISRRDYSADLVYTCALFEQIEVRNTCGACSINAKFTHEDTVPLLSGLAR